VRSRAKESQTPWASTKGKPTLKIISVRPQADYIHRDLKPENFVMSVGPSANQLGIINFALMKLYRDGTTHAHIPQVERKSLTGTARYASVGALKSFDQSWRDDMETLGYV
jgi:casein kinase 1